jgi:UDP-N-acetyl-2-amino-2-deoxyglucuronate dehydrogenase
MKPHGVAIVGCGAIAPFHARALAELPDLARLVAVQTSQPAKADAVWAAYGTRGAVCGSVAELVGRPDVEVVIVCTPSGAHLEPALAAAAAGKHVVVEKPLEVSLERCDQLIAACRNAGVRLGAIFPSRFGDANRALAAAIAAGRFGRLTLADTTVKWWRPQSYYDQGQWRGTWALDGGGALMNQAIHNVDLLLAMMGPAAEVAAFAACRAHERIEVEDTAVAVVRFRSGALGTIQAATSAYPGLPKTIAVHGERGSVVIEQDRVATWQFAEELPEDAACRQLGTNFAGAGGAADPKAISHEGHRRQLADFLQALRTNREPEVGGQEARAAVELILAIYRAQAHGAVVQLPLQPLPS